MPRWSDRPLTVGFTFSPTHFFNSTTFSHSLSGSSAPSKNLILWHHRKSIIHRQSKFLHQPMPGTGWLFTHLVGRLDAGLLIPLCVVKENGYPNYFSEQSEPLIRSPTLLLSPYTTTLPTKNQHHQKFNNANNDLSSPRTRSQVSTLFK